jgi:hypothetical protein
MGVSVVLAETVRHCVHREKFVNRPFAALIPCLIEPAMEQRS